MALTKATKSPLRCRGFNGRHHDIFTGFEYAKLRHGKLLCKACRDILKERAEEELFWRLLLNKVG